MQGWRSEATEDKEGGDMEGDPDDEKEEAKEGDSNDDSEATEGSNKVLYTQKNLLMC